MRGFETPAAPATLKLCYLSLAFLRLQNRLELNQFPDLEISYSLLFLTAGVLILFFLPRQYKSLGWVGVLIGVLLVFFSSRAILNPTSLWQFFVSLAFFVGGYQLLTTGRLNI